MIEYYEKYIKNSDALLPYISNCIQGFIYILKNFSSGLDLCKFKIQENIQIINGIVNLDENISNNVMYILGEI